MQYSTLIMDAKSRVPGFDSLYEEEVKKGNLDEESGIHTVFDFVFLPLLRQAIDSKASKLNEMIGFMEAMEDSNDVLVAEVLEFTVLESLCDDYPHKTLWPLFVGTRIQTAYERIREYMPE